MNHDRESVKVIEKITIHGHISGLAFSHSIFFILGYLEHSFLIKYSKFNNWPWKFKVKVTAKVKFFLQCTLEWQDVYWWHGTQYKCSMCYLNQHVDFAINTLRPRQNGHHFADDIFKFIILNENVWIPIKNSLKFVPKCPINNIPSLVQIMAWPRPGDKPLSESMMAWLSTHICVTRSQWVKWTTGWMLLIRNKV